VRIALGSDAIYPMFGENTRELGWFVKAGMTPEHALRTATAVAPVLLGAEGSLGRWRRRRCSRSGRLSTRRRRPWAPGEPERRTGRCRDAGSGRTKDGRRCRRADPPAAESAQGPDPHVRAEAVSVLGAFELPHETTTWQSAPAASSLAEFRTAVREALPDLLPAIRDPDATVRGNTALAFQVLLRSLDDDEAGPALSALAAALDDPQSTVRRDALQALGEVAIERGFGRSDRQDARQTMASLRRTLQDRDGEIRSLAQDWLKLATQGPPQ
jgi:hypothetical protein